MRHLIVPNRLVEDTLSVLKENGWLAQGMRVVSHQDGEHRLVPLDTGAPAEFPEPIRELEITTVEGSIDERVDSDWWTHLTKLVGKKEIEKHGDSWPSSHEFISDMMVVRIEENLDEHSESIAKAKLISHPHIRLILRDEGVQGELRIRKLSPIGARIDNQIVTESIPKTHISTRVTVKESGVKIACDPNKAYFSSKLQTERLETLSLAKLLRRHLGRPISICDPFCGVGPALATLLSEKGLVSEVLASDLNPDAIELLLQNLSTWDKREYPIEPTMVRRVFDDRIVGVADAMDLAQNPEFRAKWDMLIVNLPHRTIDILPSLTGLLDMNSVSIVRGRAIVAESEIDDANEAICEALPPRVEGSDEPSLKIKRDYSSSLRLCSFQAWIAPV
jgi:tRNA G37 N-methylase Trm5